MLKISFLVKFEFFKTALIITDCFFVQPITKDALDGLELEKTSIGLTILMLEEP